MLHNACITSIVDANSFQVVTKKRKNLSNKNILAPNVPVFLPPPSINLIVNAQDSDKSFAPTSSASKTPSNLKPPIKIFQEISNDFIFEVIPAIPSNANN